MRNNGLSTRIMLHSIIHAVLQKYYGHTAEYLLLYTDTQIQLNPEVCTSATLLWQLIRVQYSLSLPVDTYTCEREGLMHA